MNRKAQLNRAARALLIFIALAGLCFTDAAGPRLLPFAPAPALLASASSNGEPLERGSFDASSDLARQRALTTENFQGRTLQQDRGSKSNQFHPFSVVGSAPALPGRTQQRAQSASLAFRLLSLVSSPPGRAPPFLS